MMRLLLGLHVAELVGQLEHLLVRVHVAVLLVLNAFFGENTGHRLHIVIGAPMDVQNLVLVIGKLVLGAANHTEVRGSLLIKADWHLLFRKLLVVGWVLHLFEHNALFHLANVLLLDNTHQRSELLKHKVRVEFVILTHTLGQEALTAFLR